MLAPLVTDPQRLMLSALVARVALAACTAGTRPVGPGPHPPELVGSWVDSRATETDSIIWVLATGGSHRRLHLTVARDAANRSVLTRTTKDDGQWYLLGALGDSTGRAFCVTRRPGRLVPTCVPFRLDTVASAGSPRRRRLAILLEPRDDIPLIVLFERVP